MEMLIYHRSYVCSSPLRDARNWRPGDVVAIKPDGHQWGARETQPDFYVLTVPDADYAAYMQPVVSPVTDEPTQRRQRRIDLSALPRTVRRSLFDTGRATITATVLQNATVTNRTRRQLTAADR